MRENFGLALLFVILIFAWILYRWHRSDKKFDLSDLLMENGHVSKIAVAFMLTLLVTSWIMIYLTSMGKLTEGYLTIYAGAWIAPIVARIVKGTPQPDKTDVA